jgi:hypothetical protein
MEISGNLAEFQLVLMAVFSQHGLSSLLAGGNIACKPLLNHSADHNE